MWDASRWCVCGFFFFSFFYTPVNQSLQRVWNENLAPCSKIRAGISVLKKTKRQPQKNYDQLACWIHPAEEEPCDTVYDPEDYGGPDAIILIAGAGLLLAGSPEPPCSGPHDVSGSQFDEIFFLSLYLLQITLWKRQASWLLLFCCVFFFFPFFSKWGCGNPKRWQGGEGNVFN